MLPDEYQIVIELFHILYKVKVDQLVQLSKAYVGKENNRNSTQGKGE
jgi:hypothetical protein